MSRFCHGRQQDWLESARDVLSSLQGQTGLSLYLEGGGGTVLDAVGSVLEVRHLRGDERGRHQCVALPQHWSSAPSAGDVIDVMEDAANAA